MILSIRPVDVLFFRDSKPFSRGSEHFSKSIFPPYPQTLYGALRTKALEELGCDFEMFANGKISEDTFSNKELLKEYGIDKIKEEIGTPQQPGKFSLKGPFLLHQERVIYLKLPADVKKKTTSNDFIKLTPFNWEDEGIYADCEIKFYPHFITEDILEDEDAYISLGDFTDFYLLNRAQLQRVQTPNEIFTYEKRVGIQLDSQTSTTQEGKLYTISVVRMKDDWSFCVFVENLSILPQTGTIKLGGANRVCEFRHILDNEDPFRFYYQKINDIKNQINQSKKFRLVFLTPAIFKKGWLPEKVNNNYELEINNLKLKLITACINKPEYISGWDIAKKRPKPLKKLVPAGSVYYFELVEGDVDELFEIFNLKNFSDENSQLGFGLTIIGGL